MGSGCPFFYWKLCFCCLHFHLYSTLFSLTSHHISEVSPCLCTGSHISSSFKVYTIAYQKYTTFNTALSCGPWPCPYLMWSRSDYQFKRYAKDIHADGHTESPSFITQKIYLYYLQWIRLCMPHISFGIYKKIWGQDCFYMNNHVTTGHKQLGLNNDEDVALKKLMYWTCVLCSGLQDISSVVDQEIFCTFSIAWLHSVGVQLLPGLWINSRLLTSRKQRLKYI